jgi:Fe-S cluster assembly ATP-binding protein
LRRLIEILAPEKMREKTLEKELQQKFDMEKFLDRDINDGLSGGEIKKSELFLLLMKKPDFLILDEPDSGVDPEHLKNIGEMINEILQNKDSGKNGLVVTHSAAILDYIHTDKAHVMLDGKIHCSGNPVVMMEQIRKNGYKYCITCQNRNGRDCI